MDLGQWIRFYQAPTSKLYGNAPALQHVAASSMPCSPYAAAKLYAYWITVKNQETRGAQASIGILFNHEGLVWDESSVTRKITRAVSAIEVGFQDWHYLDKFDARPVWGCAESIWLIAQQDTVGDFVLARSQAQSVREFVEFAFEQIGVDINWRGEGSKERGIDVKTGMAREQVSPRYFGPAGKGCLIGDARKAGELLGWKTKTHFHKLAAVMVGADRAAIADWQPQRRTSD